MSRGKKFETEISRSLPTFPFVGYIRRHPDTLGERFQLTNPIDFSGCTPSGTGLFVECKALKGTSMPFSRFSEVQWDALALCTMIDAEVYVLLNHYGWEGQSGQRGRAYCIPFARFIILRSELQAERRSWPVSDLVSGAHELVKVTQPKAAWSWPSLE